MDPSRAALVVIDLQNGFVNQHSQHVVPAVQDLVDRWAGTGGPVIFTRYFNHAGSPYERFFQWSRLQRSPETDIVRELADQAVGAYATIDKTAYTLFTPEAAELIRNAGWTDLVFCGVATESCVLKSAADAFEHGYAPKIVTDACASDAGPEMHEAGLLVARRLIGPRQLITSDDAVRELSAPCGAVVLE